MRRSPFFIALAAGLSTASLMLSGMSTAPAQEVVEQAAEQATDTADSAADTASDAADSAADTASGATESASDAAESAEAQVDSTVENSAPSEPAVAPSAAADVDSNIQVGEQPQVQGNAGVQAQVDAQGQPLPNAQVGANAGVNAGLNADPNQAQINAQQSGQLNTNNQLNANSQLSAEQIDQRLGLQFDQNARAAAQGMAISNIQRNSMLYRSGLRRGDVLLSVDNRPFANRAEFTRLITTYGQNRIPLIVMRNGQRRTVYFSRPAEFAIQNHVQSQRHAQSQAILGVTFDSRIQGAAIVRAVTPQSPAEQAGILAGDAITGLNGKAISAPNQVVDMVRMMQPGQQVTIDFARNQERLQAEAILVARTELNRHTVGYAPDMNVQQVPAPAGQAVIRDNSNYRVQPQLQPINPGDPDGDGRRLDGDGRLPRRVLNRR